MGYMESLNLYQHTHSRELLDTIAAGRPLALYQLLEKDLAKAMNSWTLTDWKTCIIALDNNQVKKSSYNAKHKAKTVSLGELRFFNVRNSVIDLEHQNCLLNVADDGCSAQAIC